jgi:hypothetical protein
LTPACRPAKSEHGGLPPFRSTRIERYRPSCRSTFFRLTPTFLTARFTAAPDLPVFFASYLTSYFCPPATRARSCFRPRALFAIDALLGCPETMFASSNTLPHQMVPIQVEGLRQVALFTRFDWALSFPSALMCSESPQVPIPLIAPRVAPVGIGTTLSLLG